MPNVETERRLLLLKVTITLTGGRLHAMFGRVSS
jgi:hypothetical protein